MLVSGWFAARDEKGTVVIESSRRSTAIELAVELYTQLDWDAAPEKLDAAIAKGWAELLAKGWECVPAEIVYADRLARAESLRQRPRPRPDMDCAAYQAVLDRYGMEAEVGKLEEEVVELRAALAVYFLHHPEGDVTPEALAEVIQEAGDVLKVIRAIDLGLGGLIEQAARSKMIREQCRMLPERCDHV